MKRIKKILFALFSLALITSSCDKDFEELNQDPNNSTALPAHLLLGSSQRIYTNVLYGVLGGTGGDMGAIWAQHMTKVQYNDEERYVPRRGVIDNIYNSIYSNVASETNAMYNLAAEEENQVLQGAALVMKGVAFQTLAELYGPVPFTEALDQTILKPAYDDEATVFEGVIDLYTQAAGLLGSGNGSIEATSDLYYGGDASQWRKLANSLKFRALMRISSTRDVSSELQALVNGGQLFTSNADNAQLPYLEASPDANPFYETIVFGSRLEYKINSALTDLMESLNDPRLEVYAGENVDGDIVGKPSGYGSPTTLPNEDLGYTYANISGLGDFYLDPTLPGVLMSYSQLNFLMAEAANEGYISGGTTQALEYYMEGIQASFDFNGVDASTYLAQTDISFSSQAEARTKIGQQEWLALFGQGFEAWTEWRRTKLPALSPAIEGALNQIPSRYYYPTTEVSLNKDNYDSGAQRIGGDELTSALFWQ
ncbi:SusD/RagB family nutrient-binding outer membrane lipoprotein [Galbibacter sp. EGI 63066]|uniref:SusD/RagB family nutrient-binding outer membrane lipoprotein n=1 Tax=Galbibacter sp. EGI 63066 TaxID=2993559 RepID=UPI00224963B1|nr:SusD/RagB family nutrient-binding outer membrane lipoprotein [Galbibacter sp. EGI 63066]MCX2679439.1 SusD/RagB family nutrient-binding outer membrane lipoprotein [Galbibacter sp. EGI 63066]